VNAWPRVCVLPTRRLLTGDIPEIWL